MNNIGYYNRRACQRCHAQKLSCRPETQTDCFRCIKANAKCVPRSSLRLRKCNNPLGKKSEGSCHSKSGIDRVEAFQYTTELSYFEDDIWGSTHTDNTASGASGGTNSKTPIFSKTPLTNYFSEHRDFIPIGNSFIAVVQRHGGHRRTNRRRGF